MPRIFSRITALALFALLLGWKGAVAVPAASPFGTYEGALFSPTVSVLESSPSQIRLGLVMGNVTGSETVDLFSDLPGLWGEMNPTGALIPRFTIFLALPPTGNPSVTVEEWDTIPLAATPRSLPDNPPSASVIVGTVGILGGVRVVPVTFHPIAYVNNTNTCQVMSQAVVRVDIDESSGQNPVTDPPDGFSRAWQQVFRAIVSNWRDIPNYSVTVPSHILMIVPDQGSQNFVPNVQNFVRWKEQRGVKVTVLPRSSIGAAPIASAIRNRIIQERAAADPPIDFVILVGDESLLMPFYQYTADPPTRFSTQSLSGYYTSEGYFASLEGTDVFPDVFVGRWVVNTSQEVLNIVNRTVFHEKDPFRSDSARFTRSVVAADFTEPSQKETKRHVRRELLNRGFTVVDSVFVQNGAERMRSRVELGQTFVNYRGSGWDFGWAGIGFYAPNIPNVNNTWKFPIVTGIGCGVGIFDGSDNSGFGETWMNSGSTSQPIGAVGFIGPCWNTHTVYNDCLDSLLYRAWLNYDVLQLAPALAAGNMMVWATLAKFLGESAVLEVTQTMFRQYMVQGDPSLQVYTQTPVRPMVITPEEILTDATEVIVSVSNMASLPSDSVNVTVWFGDGNFSTGWIRQGSSSVSVPVVVTVDDTAAIVTVTGENVVAFQDTVPVHPSIVDPLPRAEIPEELVLEQNYPNPFNSETVIEFALPQSGVARLEIFDILGKHVATLVDESFAPGRYRAHWNGRTEWGTTAGSGIYFYRLSSPSGLLVRKLILVR